MINGTTIDSGDLKVRYLLLIAPYFKHGNPHKLPYTYMYEKTAEVLQDLIFSQKIIPWLFSSLWGPMLKPGWQSLRLNAVGYLPVQGKMEEET